MKFTSFLLIVLMMSACQTSKPSATQPASQTSQEDLLNDIWVLEVLEGQKVTITDFGRELPRLEFRKADGRVSGTTSCNSLSGSYTVEKSKLTFGPLITTRMACPGDGEQRFLEALKKVDGFKISDLKLYLLAGPEVKLQFKKVD